MSASKTQKQGHAHHKRSNEYGKYNTVAVHDSVSIRV